MLSAALVTVAAFLVGFLQRVPCTAPGSSGSGSIYGRYCYSDLPVLYQSRGLNQGIFPYSSASPQHPLEYPVLMGYVIYATERITRFISPGAHLVERSRVYYEVNSMVLLGFAVIMVLGVVALLRRYSGRRGDWLLVAAAPALILTGTINWDLIAVAAAVLAVLAWAYDRPVLAGALIGLGTAAKLFPVFILGPLLVLCLRRDWWEPDHNRWAGTKTWLKASVVGALVWLVVNLPVMIKYPAGWKVFFTFNQGRGADFGSIWYAFALQHHAIPHINAVPVLVLLLLCLGIAAWTWFARVEPTLEQLAFLVIAAFLLTNKVYSPQYVLWMLPFAVLSYRQLPGRRMIVDWAIWQAGELVYYFMIWNYLNNTDVAWYPVAIYLRVAATVYLCGSMIWTQRGAAATGRRSVLHFAQSEDTSSGSDSTAYPLLSDTSSPESDEITR